MLQRRLTGPKLFFQQCQGLLMKRIIYTGRKWLLFLYHFGMPLICMIGAILLTNTLVLPDPSSPSLIMSISDYKNPVTVYAYEDEVYLSIYDSLVYPT